MNDMSPLDWALRPLKRYAEFSGRSPRAEYWWFALGYTLFGVVLQVLARISPILGIVGILYLGLIIPMIAVGVRRMHDTDRSGWWVLAPAVPYLLALPFILPGIAGGSGAFGAGFGIAMILMLAAIVLGIVVFVFSVLPGTNGPNRFGPDPYDEDSYDEVFA